MIIDDVVGAVLYVPRSTMRHLSHLRNVRRHPAVYFGGRPVSFGLAEDNPDQPQQN